MDKKQFLECMKALGDPTRLEIVEMLREGELCACKIAEHFSMTQPTLSYHMKQLADAGLVSVRKDWKWSRYSLDFRMIGELQEYFKDHFSEV